MNRKLRVAVIGCGTAGAAIALFLKRAGHHVSVFEKVAEPQAVGAGILLQPTGMAALQRLGLLEKVLSFGARIERLYGTNHSGKTVLDIHYSNYEQGCYGLGIHRGSLFQILYDELIKNQVELYCGYDIQSVKYINDEVSLQDQEGKVHGLYDLVIIANGANSALRDLYYPKCKVTPYRWGALWAICPDPLNKFDGCLRQVYHGAKKMLGVLPTGKIPGGTEDLVSFFWSIRVDQLELWRSQGLDVWKEEVLSIWPELIYLIDKITDSRQLIFASYSDVRSYPWHMGQLVLIGDAAHATSPQLGQGANLALYDAMVLSDCLHQNDTVDAALNRYSKLRRAHLGYYQMASHWLTPFFQSDSIVLGMLRDLAMESCCRYWPARNQMLDTLVGIKSGLFRRIKLDL